MLAVTRFPSSFEMDEGQVYVYIYISCILLPRILADPNPESQERSNSCCGEGGGEGIVIPNAANSNPKDRDETLSPCLERSTDLMRLVDFSLFAGLTLVEGRFNASGKGLGRFTRMSKGLQPR